MRWNENEKVDEMKMRNKMRWKWEISWDENEMKMRNKMRRKWDENEK